MGKRSELKENILASKVEIALKWIIANRPAVLGGVVTVVVAALISSVFVLRKNELRDTNWTRLAQAESFFNQKMFDQSKQILEEVRASAPDTNTYIHASYYLAEVALAKHNFDEAIQVLSDLVDRSSGHPLNALALSNLGGAYEQKKDFDAAARTYQRFMDKFGDHFLAARTELALGRTLALANRKDESRKALEQLIDLYPTSDWAEKARAIMDKNLPR